MKKVPLTIAVIFLVIMGIITFILYHSDKQRAIKGRWRISETTLLLFSFFGGSFGAYAAMKILRHKTQHAKFFILVPFFMAIHTIILVFFIF